MNLIVFSEEEWGRVLDRNDERAVHIRDILHLGPGDTVKVGLLSKGVGRARLAGYENDGLVLTFPDAEELAQAPDPLPVSLLLGHPRPPVLQRLLKDTTAMGVGEVHICSTTLSEKSYFSSRIWTKNVWRDFVIQGARQGGQVHLPWVERHWSVKRGIAAAVSRRPNACRIVLDPDPAAGNLLEWTHLPEAVSASGLIIAIGPERGWTDDERLLFREAGFDVVGMGRSVLRTETAVVLACGVASMLFDAGPAVAGGTNHE